MNDKMRRALDEYKDQVKVMGGASNSVFQEFIVQALIRIVELMEAKRR